MNFWIILVMFDRKVCFNWNSPQSLSITWVYGVVHVCRVGGWSLAQWDDMWPLSLFVFQLNFFIFVIHWLVYKLVHDLSEYGWCVAHFPLVLPYLCVSFKLKVKEKYIWVSHRPNLLPAPLQRAITYAWILGRKSIWQCFHDWPMLRLGLGVVFWWWYWRMYHYNYPPLIPPPHPCVNFGLYLFGMQGQSWQ